MYRIEVHVTRTLTAIALTLLFTVASCSPRGPVSTTVDAPVESAESRLHRTVNEQRRSKGHEALHRDTRLDQEAQRHSQRMADGRVAFSHRGFGNRAERLQGELPLSTVAENLARNRGFPDPVATAMAGWLRSTGHRQNLLGDYDVTGIGIAEADDGTLFFTQLFGKSLFEESLISEGVDH